MDRRNTFLKFYSQEAENLKFVVGVDLSAALPCSGPTGNTSPEWQAFEERFDMSVESNHTMLGWLYAEKLGDDPGAEDYKKQCP